jgi:Roadblock/LC7 domain
MKKLTEPEYVLGYAVYSPEAIPIKFKKLEYKQVVQYGALISNLLMRTKRNIIRLDLQPPDTELQTIRIRTAKDTELIISHLSDYFMLVIQQCEGKNKPQAEEGKAEEAKDV